MTTELKRPGVWGIDLGQCALKAIRLERNDNGAIEATAFDYIEHPKILSQPDADPDQLTREALEKFLSRNDLKGDTIAISVPGQSGLARFVKLPPVDEKKIPDIVRFEAKQQIPFPLEEVVWAYQRLGSGMMTDNMVLDAEIGLFAMKRDMVNRYLQHFKDVNVEVQVIQMAPLALCNFVAHDLLGKGAGNNPDEEGGTEKSCIVALDIGADNSNLVITDGEKIIWQRPIPLGGNHFTRALTKDLKLTFAKAEHLKRNAMKSPDLKKILAALKPVLNDFVSEVQRSLGYFTNTHRDATVQYMLGLGNAFRLPGLQKYLQEKLQLEVKKLQKIQRLGGQEAVTAAPQYVENVLSFAVAHGLALQGLAATRVQTNLLPPEIARERFIRAKKPWAAAAAALLLLICPPLLIGYAAINRAWNNPAVTTAVGNLKKNKDAAAGDISQYDAAQKNAEENRQKILNMAGGINERLNWLHLNNFINEALPRPDPRDSHLVETAHSGAHPLNAYIVGNATRSGSTAFLVWSKHKEKLAKGEQLSLEEQKEDEDIVKRNLVQVHIESVAAFYSENLGGEFFPKLVADKSRKSSKLYGLYGEAAKNVRENKAEALPKNGWVVELRGFTYHDDGYKFVLNTLVENLADLANPEAASRKLASVKLHPETEKAIRDKDGKPRIGYVMLYDYESDAFPGPGNFLLIGHSSVAELVGLGGALGAVAGGGPGRGAAAAAAAEGGGKEGGGTVAPVETSTKRNGWRPPSGTVIGESFSGLGATGGGVGGGRGPSFGKGGPPTFVGAKTAPVETTPMPAGLRRQPRTEFVVLFVWQEPTLADPVGTGVP
jgi:type IV pilus assembly protein PilM